MATFGSYTQNPPEYLWFHYEATDTIEDLKTMFANYGFAAEVFQQPNQMEDVAVIIGPDGSSVLRGVAPGSWIGVGIPGWGYLYATAVDPSTAGWSPVSP
jgi:hypothetical protein